MARVKRRNDIRRFAGTQPHRDSGETDVQWSDAADILRGASPENNSTLPQELLPIHHNLDAS
jgi:hypothetical protein